MQKLLLISVIDQSATVVIKNPLKIADKSTNRLSQAAYLRFCCLHKYYCRILVNPFSARLAACIHFI